MLIQELVLRALLRIQLLEGGRRIELPALILHDTC